jgi:hypothetical protein
VEQRSTADRPPRHELGRPSRTVASSRMLRFRLITRFQRCDLLVPSTRFGPFPPDLYPRRSLPNIYHRLGPRFLRSCDRRVALPVTAYENTPNRGYRRSRTLRRRPCARSRNLRLFRCGPEPAQEAARSRVDPSASATRWTSSTVSSANIGSESSSLLHSSLAPTPTCAIRWPTSGGWTWSGGS